ncbi:hypothetical protein A3I58_00340 [Candidatus Peregrinibacteria bacterium RIFCSPLOWO2_02_FULL_39_10]|nr:MAG: hypothetical protein A3I58_00340 [Candidatus Peregrinibacteria bacterium RIFCSPLOWO2_02_FULL_39_10]
MNFRDGTKVTLLFPGKYQGNVAAIQTQIIEMEKWIQQKFGENGIMPGHELTITIMEDVPGQRPIRGHGGSNNILLNAGNLTDRQRFFDTYLHERTHSVLGAASLHPFNSGVVEGIANYMAAEGVTELVLGKPEIMKRSVNEVSEKILSLVKEGKTFQEAFWEYFEKHHEKDNYSLNYEYGQAFVEAVIKHYNGDLSQFLKIYSQLGQGQYEYADSQSVSSLLMRAMENTGIIDNDIIAIFQETSGIIILKAYRGTELVDVLLMENPQTIEAILGEQELETIFGLKEATLSQLIEQVFKIKRHILENANGRNQSNARKIIEILEKKMSAKMVRKGAVGDTQYYH